MERDDRFYAFIVATTSRSRSRIRRISFHRRWIKVSAILVSGFGLVVLFGLYGLAQYGSYIRVRRENERLRAENRLQEQKLGFLNSRVEAVEDASRRIAEMSGVNVGPQTMAFGTGGPAFRVSGLRADEVEFKTRFLEQNLSSFEAALRHRAVTPSLWPVEGELESGFGGRRNPFGGSSFEFHSGQDIDAGFGTPVKVAANGIVLFSGWQNGYGQVVIVDHGDGLTTRYGHLSKIAVMGGVKLLRGEVVGYVGSTGRSTGPHLHYEVRVNDNPVDPRNYLPGASGY